MSEWLGRFFSRPSGPLLLLAGYFLLQWALRTTMGTGFELDESEQLLFAQRLQLGYSADPPLYTWLQIPLLRLFGESAAALALLKNLLLFLTYACCYFIGRGAGLNIERAGLAALSLILLPQIGWESQRDLTHSVLVTTVAAAALWTLVSLLNGRRGPGQYALLGLLFGLGLLSKYNFAIFILVVTITLATLQPRLVWRPASLLTLSICALTVTPFAYWLIDHIELATSTAHKLGTDVYPSYWKGVAAGLVSLVRSYAAFCGLLLLALLISFRPWSLLRGASLSKTARPAAVLLLQRMLWITLLVLIIILLSMGSMEYRDRYLLPVLFFFPLIAFLLLPANVFLRGVSGYRRWLLAAMVLIPLGLLVRGHLLPLTGKQVKLAFPGQSLAQALIRDAGAPAFVIANRSFIGGNLKPYLGIAFVASTRMQFPLRELLAERGQPILLVWEPGRSGREFERVKHYLRQQLGSQVQPLSAPGQVSADYRYTDGRKAVLAWQLWGKVPASR
ncbi:MAG: hypothetical protein GY792_25940 [Gammaproteobacteria bacterium]|nr:hypothetical protein [Gammaproteobacteria bacterium]